MTDNTIVDEAANYMQVEMFVWCEHCKKSVSTFKLEHFIETFETSGTGGNASTSITHLRCPNCHKDISRSYFWDSDLKIPYEEPKVIFCEPEANQQPLSGKGVDEDELHKQAVYEVSQIINADTQEFEVGYLSYLAGYKAATKGYTLKDIEDAYAAGRNSIARSLEITEDDKFVCIDWLKSDKDKEQYLSSINKK